MVYTATASGVHTADNLAELPINLKSSTEIEK